MYTPVDGDRVLYTTEFDTDKSEIPNIVPAMVMKTHTDGTLDLMIGVSNGAFWKLNVPLGEPGQRLTWHHRPSGP